MSRALALAFALAACDDDVSVVTANGDLAVADLAIAPEPDFSVPGTARIGEPCVSDSDCGEGFHPLCFHPSVSGFPPATTPGGYCSGTCGNSPYDCGATALCMWFGFTQAYCFASCASASDCRAGYACLTWSAPVCFPRAPFLDCDPTAGDGSCTTPDGKPGGCYRLALGGRGANAGRCGARCDVGAGHCAPDPSGAPLRCSPKNDTLDVDGGATDDRWIGPICDLLNSEAGFGGCIYGWSTPPLNVASACADGLDCASQFDPYGDEDCRQLCYLDGGAPGFGAGLPPACRYDGGCSDVYRLAATVADPQKRVGLCPPGP
jgi:hypothetical protein